jgi:ribonuclease PH
MSSFFMAAYSGVCAAQGSGGPNSGVIGNPSPAAATPARRVDKHIPWGGSVKTPGKIGLGRRLPPPPPPRIEMTGQSRHTAAMPTSRPTPRRFNQLRPLSIQRRFPTAAPGSVLISMGETRVLCTATISTDLPPWMKNAEPPRGWVTAEYAMLPGSTADRKKRGNDGRATEIQRLIGRALRAAVDLQQLPGLQITCDCDVIRADGGTRTASITGAYVALADAIAHARRTGLIPPGARPLLGPVAAVSVGVVDGRCVLDLDYALDSRADVDMNIVMNAAGRFVEIQGTAEGGTFDSRQFDAMLRLARRGIRRLIEAQKQALARK